MRRILFCASTASHLKRFHLPYLRAFREAGWEVWTAADTAERVPYADRSEALPLVKSMTSPQNAQAVLAARKLLAEGGFDAVSVHTTLAAAAVRGAALTMKKRPRIFYTCHGYLFSGADSAARRAMYLAPEKLCAPVTDVLMVMNREDREIAVKHRLSADGAVRFIPGMGVEFSRYARHFSGEERLSARRRFGYGEKDFLFVYAAEFSARKNHAFLLRAFAGTARRCPNARLLLAGNGALRNQCIRLAQELGVSGRVLFAGELSGMEAIYPMCDAAVSTSRSEGLPFNVMEAMAAGLPVAATQVKGHEDLIRPGESGLLFSPDSPHAAAEAMTALYHSPGLCAKLADSASRSLNRYELSAVMPQILSVYREFFPGEI